MHAADNVFEDNIAAGGDAFGFWINLPRHPGGFLSFSGATFTDDIFPRHAPVGSFTRNTAHGYRIGFLAHDLDPKGFDKRRQVKRTRDGWSRQWFKEVHETPGLRRSGNFSRLLAFSNSERGAIIADMGHFAIHDFVSAPGAGGQPVGLSALKYAAEQWGDGVKRARIYIMIPCPTPRRHPPHLHVHAAPPPLSLCIPPLSLVSLPPALTFTCNQPHATHHHQLPPASRLLPCHSPPPIPPASRLLASASAWQSRMALRRR